MAELLDASRRAHGIAWGIVTNKAERFARPLIDALGLTARCACVVGGDTAARPKPFPDPLLHACISTGMPLPLFLCRRRHPRHPGRQGGRHAHRRRAYGYLGSSPSPSEAWDADAIIDAPARNPLPAGKTLIACYHRPFM
jgi:phosphoglycolate phosphatase-like HAD superfamily hydrolase